jgi:hypothetical protein
MDRHSTVERFSPLEWGGIDPSMQQLLNRVIIERDDDIVVQDGPSGRVLFIVDPTCLTTRSLVSTLIERITEFYCVGCGELFDAEGVCSGCDTDRAARLRATIALLEEEM